MYDLKVWAGVEADGSTATTTPGKTVGMADEMSRISKVQGLVCDILSKLGCQYFTYEMLCNKKVDVPVSDAVVISLY
jgi:hypothetical protein